MLPGILKIRQHSKTSEISLPDFEFKLWKSELQFVLDQKFLLVRMKRLINCEIKGFSL